jgi:predicted lysophospholipase L1 biosynthesis ABC-type transport system permease subunit
LIIIKIENKLSHFFKGENDMKMKKGSYTGIFLILGAGIGTSLGVINNQIAVMAAVGAAVGLIVGAIIESYKSKQDQN